MFQVPIGEKPHGNVSPASTTTTCESTWSLTQPRDDNITPSNSNHESISSMNASDPDFAKNLSNLTLINMNPDSISPFNDQTNYQRTALHNKRQCDNQVSYSDKDDGNTIENKNLTGGVDVGNASDTSSMGLLAKSPPETHERRKSSGSPKRKLLPKTKLRITLAKERKASTTLGE